MGEPEYINTKERIKLIRAVLKRECPTLSVRGGRGTASGWCDISGSLPNGVFTDEERRALERVGLSYCENWAGMDYLEQVAFIEGNINVMRC